MTDGTRYPIETLEQMASIPLAAMPRFLKEFPAILAQAGAIKALSEMTGAKIEFATPVWIDDDLHTGTVSVTCDGETVFSNTIDTRTGEAMENTHD